MKRLTGFLGLALVGAVLTMLVADTAFAQRSGRGGWGWGPGGYGYHGTSRGWEGGWTPGYGFYAQPRGYGYGYGYHDGHNYPRDGYGYGYYDGYNYPRYSSYYYPRYSYPYRYGGYRDGYGYQGDGPAYGYQQPMAQDNATARVQVKLPDENAAVWFDGQKTRPLGRVRTFTTPPLDGNYQYQVSCAWHQDGRLVTYERTVNVKPGANVTVDFTQRPVPTEQGVQQQQNSDERLPRGDNPPKRDPDKR